MIACQTGYAAACKADNLGSIPSVVSFFCYFRKMKLIFLMLGACVILAGCSAQSEDVRVMDKAIKVYCDKGCTSKYLISTDKGVFENTDSLIKLKFNSSDVYFYMRINRCYNIKYYWFRNTIFSQYPNIISAQEISCTEQDKTT